MKTKHWARILIDGRHIFKHEINSIESLDYQIEELQNKLNRLELERYLQEDELFDKVRNHNYTIEEITDAKEQSKICVE